MADADFRPRITRLRVQNFRSIADIDVPLGPLTVLVGPNGSGKSNVVDALRFVRDALTGGLDQAVRDREGYKAIRRWSATERGADVSIEVDVAVGGKKASYGFAFTAAPRREYKVRWERLVTRHDDLSEVYERTPKILGAWSQDLDSLKRGQAFLTERLLKPYSLAYLNVSTEAYVLTDDHGLPLAEELEPFLSSLLFYDLRLGDLMQPQRLVQEAPLDERGRNLAAALRRLWRSKGNEVDDIRLVLGRLVEGVEDLSVQAVGGYLVTRLHYAEPSGKVRKSDLSQESDGTIRMLGLLAALYQQPAPPLIAIEEPEANVHPGALGVLAGVLDQASTRGQVLVTTHSPDLLDQLPPESFLVVEKVNGETKVGPLSATQVEAVRQRLFSPSELLRMEGLEREPDADTAHAAP